MIKKLWKKFISSEFNRNSLVLVSGTTIAQLLPIIVSPILTRLYSPEDFGVLALFMSLSMILSLLATGRYELSLILPKKDSEAFNLLNLIFIIAIIFSLFLLLAILLFHDFFVGVLKEPNISLWLYFLPLTVFFLGGYTALTFYHTRLKNYKIISTYKVARSFTMASVQTGLFFLRNGTLALVLGYILAQIIGFLGLLKKVFIKNKQLKFNKLKVIALAKRYKKFPFMTLPSSLLNKLSSEMPNLLITPLFSSTILGFYSLGYRILTAPSTFIGVSISQVFMQSATEEMHKTGKSSRVFISTLKKLLVIGIPFFLVLYFTAEPVFGFVFGKEWTIAGTYAKILTPFLFTRFVASPLSAVLYVFEKHEILIGSQITIFLLSIATFAIGHFFLTNFQNFLLLYSVSLSVYYVMYLFISYLIANKKI